MAEHLKKPIIIATTIGACMCLYILFGLFITNAKGTKTSITDYIIQEKEIKSEIINGITVEKYLVKIKNTYAISLIKFKTVEKSVEVSADEYKLIQKGQTYNFIVVKYYMSNKIIKIKYSN